MVPEKRLRVSALGELIYGVTPNLQVETQAFGLALSIPNLSIKHKMFDDPYFERTYSLGAGYARNGKHNLSDLINRISQGDLFYAYLLSSKISSNTFTTSLGSYFIYWHTEGPTDLQSTLQRGLLGILSFDWNLTNSLLLHGLAVVPYFGRTKNENETISLSNQSFVKGLKGLASLGFYYKSRGYTYEFSGVFSYYKGSAYALPLLNIYYSLGA